MTQVKKFEKGQVISYRQNGICKIIDICTMKLDKKTQKYYVLQSVYDESTQIFVPIDTPDLDTLMRNVPSKQQIDTAIHEFGNSTVEWVDNARKRTEKYDTVLHTGNRIDILKIVKLLTIHKTEVEKVGHKFYASDENLLNRATKIITEEFAYTLGIDRANVIPYIVNELKNNTSAALVH